MYLKLACFREKKSSRSGALKVLSYATAIPDGAQNCDKFIEIYGMLILTGPKLTYFRFTSSFSYVYADSTTNKEKGHSSRRTR
jgi:hypothetical protein